MAKDPIVIPYGEIPGFSVSTAPGHKGQLVFGTLGGKSVAVMQGRLHAYEGYSFEEVCFPLRVLRLLGCNKLVITNASGGVNLSFRVETFALLQTISSFLWTLPFAGRTSRNSAPGSRTPPTYTPRGCRRSPENRSGPGAGPGGRRLYVLPRPLLRNPGGNPRHSGAGRRSGGHEHRARGNCRRSMPAWRFWAFPVSNAAAGITGNALSEQEVLDAAAAAKERFSKLIYGCVEAM